MGVYAEQHLAGVDRPHEDLGQEDHQGPAVDDDHGVLPRPASVVEAGEDDVEDGGVLWGTEEDEDDWLSGTMPYVSLHDPCTPGTAVEMTPDRVGGRGGWLPSKDDFLKTSKEDMESSLYWETVFDDTWCAKDILTLMGGIHPLY